MIWIPIGAWIGAGVLALVVLGFCGYEIVWKAKRLQADVARLDQTAQRMTDLHTELTRTQQRIATIGRG